MRNNRGTIPGGQGSISPISPGGFPINRMMPGMPGARKMPGMPGIDSDNWEVPRSRTMPRGDNIQSIQPASRVQPPLISKLPSLNSKFLPQGSGALIGGTRTSALLQGSGTPPVRPPTLGYVADPTSQVTGPVRAAPPAAEKIIPPSVRSNPEVLQKKTISLLEEYFNVMMLDEALQCVQELNSPAYHSEFVKESISLALEKSRPFVEPVAKLLEYLFAKKVLSAGDIGTGCLLYGSMLDDIGIDLPKAPNNFGEIMGRLILAGGLEFKVVKEVLKKMEDVMLRKAVFAGAIRIVTSVPSGEKVLFSQASEIKECESLF